MQQEWERGGEERNGYRILVGKTERKGHLGDQVVEGWIILKWILERYDKEKKWAGITIFNREHY
jgi:hypothetical protein